MNWSLPLSIDGILSDLTSNSSLQKDQTLGRFIDRFKIRAALFRLGYNIPERVWKQLRLAMDNILKNDAYNCNLSAHSSFAN